MKNILVALFFLNFCACTAPSESNNNQDTISDNNNTPKEETAIPKKEKKKTILYFGDSLTAAYNLETSDGYPAKIQEKIEAMGLNYKTVNAGISGETSTDGKARIDWVLQQPVDIFVLALGANDMLRGTDLGFTKKNLQAILDKVKTAYPDAKLVIAGMLAPPNLGKTYTNKFKAIFPDLAKANNATLIPFLLDGVAGQKDLNLADGIHPTAEGYKIVANNVWEVLQAIL